MPRVHSRPIKKAIELVREPGKVYSRIEVAPDTFRWIPVEKTSTLEVLMDLKEKGVKRVNVDKGEGNCYIGL